PPRPVSSPTSSRRSRRRRRDSSPRSRRAASGRRSNRRRSRSDHPHPQHKENLVSEESNPATDRLSRVQRLEQEGDIAADYLAELLDIADLDGDLDMDVEGDRAAVSILGGELDQLIGPRGEVLAAPPALTRLAVYRETGE